MDIAVNLDDRAVVQIVEGHFECRSDIELDGEAALVGCIVVGPRKDNRNGLEFRWCGKDRCDKRECG